MHNPLNTTPITTDFLRALRKATDIIFRVSAGRATLEAVKRAKDHALEGELKATLDVGCKFTTYDEGRSSYLEQVWVAFDMIQTAQLDEAWQTIASSLRTGDELLLRWVSNNSTDNLRNAGLVQDELQLEVLRTSKGGKVRSMVYRISNTIVPAGCSCRFVREYRNREDR